MGGAWQPISTRNVSSRRAEDSSLRGTADSRLRVRRGRALSDRAVTLRYVTPLRYPGGKAKLARFVRAVLHKNALRDADYVEPYAGGAAVGLSLLINGDVARIHINDLDRSVHAFWYSVLNSTEQLCRRISSAKLSIDEWHRQRWIQKHKDEVSLLDLGRLDARFSREALIARIEAIVAYRQQIVLYNHDAALLLPVLLKKLPAKSLLYLDPPYYKKGTRRLYANTYTHADHVKVAEILHGARRPWLVSYDDVREVRALYRQHRYRRYRLAYTARVRHEGAEIIFFSDQLMLPKVQNPSTVLR